MKRASRGILLLSASFLLSANLLLTGSLRGQTESGPSAGSQLAPLKVAIITGDHAGEDRDITAAPGGKPTVVALVQADKWDRPIARFLKTLDAELSKEGSDVRVVAVWLTDNVEKSKKYLPRAQESLKLAQTSLAVFPGDKNGPVGWEINPRAHLTAVVAAKGKVVASFGYVSLNETNVPELLAKIKP